MDYAKKIYIIILIWSILVSGPGLSIFAGDGQVTPQQPNILLIFMDDVGWKDAGFMGNSYYETPNIDRLAREGMVFTDAYVNASVCIPSRACLLSGQYTPRHGVYVVNPANPKDAKVHNVPNSRRMPDGVVSIAHRLKEAGYVTGVIGKWHVKNKPAPMGFDVVKVNWPDPERDRTDPKDAMLLTRWARDFMSEHHDRPFFLWLNHQAVHVPIRSLPGVKEKYGEKDSEQEPANPEYAAMLEHADDAIGELMKSVEELKLDSNTLVLYYSDNGGHAGLTSMNPLRGAKAEMYEGGIRVPLIMRWPGTVEANTRCGVPVSSVDLYPTFLELAQIGPPLNHALDGNSLLPLLQGKPGLEDRPIFWHQPMYNPPHNPNHKGRVRPVSVVRKGSFKLLEFFDDNQLELYNLKEDIGETRNMVDKMPEKTDALYGLLINWQKSVNAPIPVSTGAGHPASPTRLRCEYRTHPLGIDSRRPRFSWIVNDWDRGEVQTAYRILVASDKQLLQKGNGDVWDSGKVPSSQQSAVVYNGNALESKTRYWWKVRTWDKDKQEGSWSQPAWFETAMLDSSDWKAEWVGGPFKRVRKQFSAASDKEIVQARAYVTGLGYYELHLNGHKVGDYVLDPARTKYRKPAEGPFSNPLRAFYRTYDVTGLIQPGSNAVGLMLADGYFNLAWGMKPQDTPRPKPFICQLEIWYEDGSMDLIASDKTWKGDQGGPVVRANVWDGEHYDAQLEDNWDRSGYDDAKWQPVKPKKSRQLTAQMTGIRVIETLKPKTLQEPQPGVYVYDLGQNIAGWCRLKVSGSAGDTIILRFAEAIHPDGNINPLSNNGARCEDMYVLKGSEEEAWEPRFTYHGFRYVEVTGFPGRPTLESISGRVVHDDVDITTRFNSSKKLLNDLFRMFQWSYRDNLNSVQTDCPQRNERLGWGGDALVTGEAVANYMDMTDFYARWIQVMADCQYDNGLVPDIIPSNMRAAREKGHVAWKAAYLSLPWDYYTVYGDTTVLARHYEGLKSFIGWLMDRAEDNHTLSSDYTPYGGDHGIGGRGGMPFPHKSKPALATAYYYHCMDLMSRIAGALNKPGDRERFSRQADKIRNAYNDHFQVRDEYGMYYASNIQTDNAIALHFGLVPEASGDEVLNSLIADIEQRDFHQMVGILGGYSLYHALQDNGRFDVAYKLATQKTAPSFGHILEQGATTVWVGLQYSESKWFSLNHPMRSAGIAAWLLKGVGGISPAAPGYGKIRINPGLVDELNWTRTAIRTIRGPVSCYWERQGNNRLMMEVSVPVNSQALVHLPLLSQSPECIIIREGSNMIYRNGQPQESFQGIQYQGKGRKSLVWEVGSGDYRFFIMPDE